MDGTAEWEDRNALAVFVHELIHSMGFSGHPDRERFTESVMSYARSGKNPHVLYGIDYDAILALYELIEPETRRVPLEGGGFITERVRTSEEQLLEELGPWMDSSTHVLGELALDSGTVTFGARARNGLAQAWARGPRPFAREGRPLQGSARWQGAILGMTPDEQAVVGDANLAVDLGALTGELSFTAMEYWQAGARPGAPGSGTHWSDGDLEYDVKVEGGTFTRTGGDDGVVTGTFFGREYEGHGWRARTRGPVRRICRKKAVIAVASLGRRRWRGALLRDRSWKHLNDGWLLAGRSFLSLAIFVEYDDLAVAYSQVQDAACRECPVTRSEHPNLASPGFAEQDLVVAHVLDVLKRDGKSTVVDSQVFGSDCQGNPPACGISVNETAHRQRQTEAGHGRDSIGLDRRIEDVDRGGADEVGHES